MPKAPLSRRGRFAAPLAAKCDGLRRGRGPAAALGMAAVVAAYLLAPVWGPEPPEGEDVMAHLVRADFAIEHLVLRGRLDGWFPRFVLGQQEFMFNGPGLTWMMALARGATFGLVSNTGALKVVGAATFALTVPAVLYLARSFGLSKVAAGFAALLALSVSNPFGPGLQGTYNVGLVSHQAAAPLFCVALGATLRGLERRGARAVVVTAAATAALAVTHVLSVLVLVVMLVVALPGLLAGRRLSRAGLIRVGAAGAGAAGVAAFWLVPAVAHRDLTGVVTTWGTPPLLSRLAAMATGDLLVPGGFAALATAGWAIGLHRGRADWAWVWATLPLGYLALSHGLLRLDPNDVTVQLANRGMGYAALVAACGAGVALEAAGARLARLARNPAVAQGALLAATAAFVATTAPGRDAPQPRHEPTPALDAAAGALARLVPDGARFATQRDFPSEIGRTGVIHPEMWLARNSGRNSLNGFNLEAVSTPGAAFEPDEIDTAPARRTADALSRLGVSHVVATTPALAARLAGHDRFTVVWEQSPITILALRGRAGQPDPATLVSAGEPIAARLVRAGPERLAFRVDAPGRRTVTLALAWSPKWHGRLDGKPLGLDDTADGLVEVAVPAGTHRLDLTYRRDAWDNVGVGVSLGSVVLAGAGVRKCRGSSPGRRRRRPPSGSGVGASRGCSARGS